MTKAHSGLRWVVLILLIMAIVKMFMGWKKNAPYTEGDRKMSLFAMLAFHIQWTIGLILYFISPKVQFVEGFMKNSMLRFYGLEHILAMTIAMALITIGYSKGKKAEEEKKKFKIQFVFYSIALIIILLSIPWPFRESLGGGWY
ncbi:MAG: cytochrome B [Crocinitomicaceae bacterium]|nr:cytochrome B [Crocinitomicaceae bacterium]